MDSKSIPRKNSTQTKPSLVQNPARLKAVARSKLIDSDPDPLFDELCLLAAETLSTPIALVTILDDQRQFFKARIGLDTPETPVEWSFCQHTLAAAEQVMVVNDALRDERVKHSPLVTGEPHIRAYMGAPVVNREGHVLGTLCVIDRQARVFTHQQQQRLARLAKLVYSLIDLQENARRELEAQKQRAALEVQQLVILLTHGLDIKAYADTSGVYRYVNPAFNRAFGLDEQEIVGRHISEITGQAVYDEYIRAHFDKAVAGQNSKYRRLAQYPIKGERWVDVELFPVFADKGAIKGVVIRARDVHEIVVAQQTIERRLINQQQFLNVLAHDVREPLRTIQGLVSLAIDEGKSVLSEDLLGFLRRAQGGGKRLSVLIDDLLAFLRADGEAIRTEPVNLARLCESVVEDLGELMRDQNAVVTHQMQAAQVMGARVWLRLLLQNLVINGIKYARHGVDPVVSITAQVEGECVRLTVSDNGVGISTQDRQQLFRPFVRLASSASVTGSGLGLALCQKVAELHGTAIEMASVPGSGSSFSILLQRATGTVADTQC